MNLNCVLAAFVAAIPLTVMADGDVIIDLAANSDDFSQSLALGPNGRIYVTANVNLASPPVNAVLAFDSNGAAITTFGTNGRISIQDAGPIAVRPDGSLITGRYHIITVSPTGTQLGSIAACGTANINDCPSLNNHFTNRYLPLSDGRTWSAGGNAFAGIGSQYWVLRRITTGGILDSSFANGAGWTRKDGGQSLQISSMQMLANGQLAVIGTDHLNYGPLALGRFNADGSTDFSFGTNGLVALATPGPFFMHSPVGVDQQQRFLVPGGANLLARYNTNGTPDSAYLGIPIAAQTTYYDFAVDSQDRVVVFGARGDQLYVARLLPNGGLDPSFGTGGEALLALSVAGASNPIVSAGAVDASDRPTALFYFVSASGSHDVGLMRATVSGALDATFGAGWVDADARPDAFSIPANTAPYGTTLVVSGTVTPTGFNVRTSIALVTTAANSGYSIGCTGTFTTTAGTIDPGQSLCLRHAAPGTAGATATTVIAVGGTQASYQTTASSTPSDTTPDAFTFSDQNGVALNTLVTSNAVAINGITGSAPISVDFGQYSIDCNPGGFRSTGSTVTNGQTVCLRTTSSASFSTAASVTLAIGGVTDTFTVTTLAADTTPDTFAFVNQSNVATSAVLTSNTVTISGINSPAATSVTNGEYSPGCNGTFTNQAGTLASGQSVCVRHTASNQASGSVSTTLTVGGVASTFTSTTSAPPPSSGGGGGAMAPRDLIWLALLLLGARLVGAFPGLRPRPAIRLTTIRG